MLYFAHFLQMKMVGKLKRSGIAWNQFFCVKNAVFHQITNLFGGKHARNQTLGMKLIKVALEYCNLTLISSLEQKNKQYSM